MIPFWHFIISALPWALLFTLPWFLGLWLGRTMWKGERDRCIECERKNEEIRTRLGRAKQEYRELEHSIEKELVS